MALFRTAVHRSCTSLVLKASMNSKTRQFGGVSYTQLSKLRESLARSSSVSHSLKHVNVTGSCLRGLSMSQAQRNESENDENKEEKKPSKKRLDVEYEELVELLKTGVARVFDVRDPKELMETGSIPTAVNIPLSRLKIALSEDVDEYKELYGDSKPRKDEEHLVFYGLCEVKSSAAVEIAHKLGYKKAKHYPGGWKEWSEKAGKSET